MPASKPPVRAGKSQSARAEPSLPFAGRAPGAAPNTVVSVLQKGYLLHERLLRPALVSVAKAPPNLVKE